VTFISFVHRPSHIPVLCFFIIPLYCMHVRMPYVLIKELTYLLSDITVTDEHFWHMIAI